ncbi:hypothetical protein FHL15_010727 [Xylaria flabelliformis]|uniref:Uncharacterized protein n=1 Tax=Xylaria flabelliformis TaxID=2512241 RepID=A0A553HK74_9PEZI|nr:hypothetical protein FHL15_010727 [Xylaria flabelliformis]
MLLHELYPNPDSISPSQIDVDVVLVHGLKGHYIRTWKAEGDKTVWPKDLLPGDLQRIGIRIRVLSFEHGGSIKDTTSKAGIDDIAQNLLQHLMDKRDEPRIRNRPILFIGHSLGGIIIKRAIQVAYMDPTFRSIKNTTLGIMYFSTPHRGSAEEFSSFLTNVLECNRPSMDLFPLKRTQPTTDMVDEIQRYPDFLNRISEDFFHFYDKLGSKSFQEGNKTAILGQVVVSSEQGKINFKDAAMISGDHLGLCKFGGNKMEKGRFIVVWKGMEKMIQDSPKQKKLTEKRTKALDSLCSDVLCQSMMTKKSMFKTGEWIYERTEFKNWLAQESGKQGLWISGGPGCGKSYLAKHIVDELRGRGESVVSAFLHEPNPTNIDAWRLLSKIIEQALDIEPKLRSGQPLFEGGDVMGLLAEARNRVPTRPSRKSQLAENNVQGLFAATARQLLDIEPKLIGSILMRVWEDDKPPEGWTPDFRALWKEVMIETLAKHRIIAVIDGFDKMERQCQNAFFETLEHLMEALQASKKPSWTRKKGPQTFHDLRLLFFSNEYPGLESDSIKYGFTRYTIKTVDTRADIKTAVGRRLEVLEKIHKYTPKLREKIGEEVPKAADGIYLRAELMLGSLKHAHYNEDGIHELLDNPPKDTAKLYDHLFEKIWVHEGNRRSVKQILSWVTFQQEGLNPVELSIAWALQKVRENTGREIFSYEEMLKFVDDHTELWVHRYCGHLIKFESGRSELVHPSLRKYLTKKLEDLREEYGKGVKLPNHADSYMDEAESHLRLGNLCATYLAMPFLAEPVRSKSKDWLTWQAGIKERMKQYPFLRYAALYWSEHLKLGRDLSIPGNNIREGKVDRERQRQLENKLLGNAQSWAEIGCYFHDWHEESYPKLCSVDEKIKHKSPPPKPVQPARLPSNRAEHWIVKGARRFVDTFELDKTPVA